jgi:plastocyanin
MRRRLFLKAGRRSAMLGAVLAVALGMMLAVSAPTTVTAQGAPVAVEIVDFGFNPANVTVPVGGRVTWTNTGQATHTATSQTGGWDSGRLGSGQSFTFTAARAGSFEYVCAIHASMRGTVVVQATAGQTAAAPAAMPRTGTGLIADNESRLPAALALGAALVIAVLGVAYRRLRA